MGGDAGGSRKPQRDRSVGVAGDAVIHMSRVLAREGVGGGVRRQPEGIRRIPLTGCTGCRPPKPRRHAIGDDPCRREEKVAESPAIASADGRVRSLRAAFQPLRRDAVVGTGKRRGRHR